MLERLAKSARAENIVYERWPCCVLVVCLSICETCSITRNDPRKVPAVFEEGLSMGFPGGVNPNSTWCIFCDERVLLAMYIIMLHT